MRRCGGTCAQSHGGTCVRAECVHAESEHVHAGGPRAQRRGLVLALRHDYVGWRWLCVRPRRPIAPIGANVLGTWLRFANPLSPFGTRRPPLFPAGCPRWEDHSNSGAARACLELPVHIRAVELTLPSWMGFTMYSGADVIFFPENVNYAQMDPHTKNK